MIAAYRSLGLAAAGTAILCGCGSSSSTSGYGSAVPAGNTTAAVGSSSSAGGFTSAAASVDGTHDSIIATPPSQLISVEVGTTKTVSVTLTSDDGRTVTGFSISNAAGEVLPAGWSAPASFGCRSLSTGSGCVLNLTFTPIGYEVDQTLTLHYVYVDNAMEPVTTDSMTLAYQATTNDNVSPVLAPAGQINASLHAGSQTVTATFATDDGHPASALTVTSDPTALPPGWTAPTSSSCASVSAGSTCQLSWVYTPTAPGSGTISIDYSYEDDSGTAKTASFNIPYAATDNNNVVGSVLPANSVNVSSGSTQLVTVTFNTDDQFDATNLSMALSSLPTGWSAPSSELTCATIGDGAVCQATLTYAPVSAGDQGTLQLPYGYSDNAGIGKTSSVNIPYTSS